MGVPPCARKPKPGPSIASPGSPAVALRTLALGVLLLLLLLTTMQRASAWVHHGIQLRAATRIPARGQSRSFRATPTCGLKIDIHIRGKRTGGEVRTALPEVEGLLGSRHPTRWLTRPVDCMLQEWLNEAYNEYVKRLRPVLALETVWHKTDEELEAAVAKERAPVICLDERGKQLTSLEVADRLYKKLEEGTYRVPSFGLCLHLQHSSIP